MNARDRRVSDRNACYQDFERSRLAQLGLNKMTFSRHVIRTLYWAGIRPWASRGLINYCYWDILRANTFTPNEYDKYFAIYAMLLIARSFSARSWTIFSHTFCHFSVLPRDVINEQQLRVFLAMQMQKNAGNKRWKRNPVCIICIYYRFDKLTGNGSLG